MHVPSSPFNQASTKDFSTDKLIIFKVEYNPGVVCDEALQALSAVWSTFDSSIPGYIIRAVFEAVYDIDRVNTTLLYPQISYESREEQLEILERVLQFQVDNKSFNVQV